MLCWSIHAHTKTLYFHNSRSSPPKKSGPNPETTKLNHLPRPGSFFYPLSTYLPIGNKTNADLIETRRARPYVRGAPLQDVYCFITFNRLMVLFGFPLVLPRKSTRQRHTQWKLQIFTYTIEHRGERNNYGFTPHLNVDLVNCITLPFFQCQRWRLDFDGRSESIHFPENTGKLAMTSSRCIVTS